MISSPCVIILDRATAAEREAVHDLIKTNAKGWWHHFKDVWVVGDHDPSFWTELIRPAIPDGPSGILVMRLPENAGDRSYSAYMPKIKERMPWLRATYAGRESAESQPSSDK